MNMENEVMIQVLMFASIIAPVTTALVEMIKKSITLSNNILPIISLLIGLVIGFASYPFTDMDTILRLWAGAFAGLSGTGLYELIITRKGTTE